jgi:dolichol-phosphate mannosyltransferase
MSQVLFKRALKKLSVVIPVFQNQDSLPKLFEELEIIRKTLSQNGTILECIFVNDGSTDDSLEIIREYRKQKPNCILINLSRNFGAVNCSKTGLGMVTGDAFVILAADLQDPPQLILGMCQEWAMGSDFVICARESRNDPFLTKLFANLYYLLLRTFVVSDYPRGGYDFALMDSKMLKPLYESSKSMYTPILAWWLGFKPFVIKYHRSKRQHGKSEWTFSKKLNSALDVFFGFSNKPIRFLTLIGFSISALSFVFGSVILIAALSNRIQVPGYATIVTLILFLFGVTILMIGVLGEYLIRVVEETNRRPFSVISSVE